VSETTWKTQVRNDVGFAVRSPNGGYLECNGIGDESLAGEVTTCEVFGTFTDAQEARDRYGDEGEDCRIVRVVRAISVTVQD
jgi:hypothetical protein